MEGPKYRCCVASNPKLFVAFILAVVSFVTTFQLWVLTVLRVSGPMYIPPPISLGQPLLDHANVSKATVARQRRSVDPMVTPEGSVVPYTSSLAKFYPPGAGKLNLTRKVEENPIADIVKKLFKNKTNGFFVEFPALDGVKSSNTLQLEVDLGWSGLLIETNPQWRVKLIKKNRKAWIAPVCVTPTTSMDLTSERIVEYEKICRPETIHLEALLEGIPGKKIDYLSLNFKKTADLIDAFLSVPFENLQIKVLSVKALTSKYSKIDQMLESQGFFKTAWKPAGRSYFTGVYAHRSFQEPKRNTKNARKQDKQLLL